MSALITPTSVTLGKSSPLAIICVPSRIRTSPVAKRVERPLVAAGLLHGVGVHPQAAMLGKAGLHFGLQPLRAQAAVANAREVAVGALRRRGRLVVAIVAQRDLLVAMVRQRDVAVRTFDHVAAGRALDVRARSRGD